MRGPSSIWRYAATLATALAFLSVLTALLALLPGGSVAPANAAETLEANTAGAAFLGRAGPHGIYEVGLAIPNDHAAVLKVTGGRIHELPFEQWAKYAVRPLHPLSSGVLWAEFGSIGSVRLRFHPEEVKLGQHRRGCVGPRPRVERGTYRGTISLRGENGYFQLHRVEAEGRRRRSFPLACDPATTTDPAAEAALATYVAPRLEVDRGTEAQLAVATEADDALLAMRAWQSRYGENLEDVAAGALELLPTLAIGRFSYGAGPIFLRVSEPGAGPLNATLQGVSYNADPAAPGTWSGELEAGFLGGGSRLLNGPGSKTRLCRYSSSGQSTECVGDSPPLISGGPFDP
jgi:hypothetical protein